LSDPPFRFQGFDGPNYTICPDQLFDQLLPMLSESELKVLLYVIRRTFGFRKDADAISISQMVNGIITQDGRVLDRGTGLSKSSVRRGVQGLIEKEILLVSQIRSKVGDYDSNVYRLRFRQGVVPNSNHPGVNLDLPVVPIWDPQETEKQQTERQEVEASKGPTRFEKYDAARLSLLPYAEDLGREFNDQAPLPSTLSRLANLHRRSGLDLDSFIDRMMQARAITQERTPAIRTQAEWPKPKPKTAYFLAVLEDLLGQARPTGTEGDEARTVATASPR
jgi:hypothetical protein